MKVSPGLEVVVWKVRGRRKLYTMQRGCAKRFFIDEDNRSFTTIRVARGIVLEGSLLVCRL
jgi:hypothetical protein